MKVAQNLGCVASDAPDEPLDPNVDAAVLTCMRAANSSEVTAAFGGRGRRRKRKRRRKIKRRT